MTKKSFLNFYSIVVADRILFYSSRLLTLPTAPRSENTLMLVKSRCRESTLGPCQAD